MATRHQIGKGDNTPVQMQTEKLENGRGKPGEIEASQDYIENPYLVSSLKMQGKNRKLPAWLDHFNVKDLKTLFKCSVAVWIATIFIFIDPVLATFGQATFFGWYLYASENDTQTLIEFAVLFSSSALLQG
jgi:Putative ER transporter, 6TM, N-terminal